MQLIQSSLESWNNRVRSKKVLGSHFVIGGRNSSESFSQLTTLNGISIEKLEAYMRSGRPTDIVSSAGLLGPHESLKGILIKDNETVLNQLHLTHQEIAYHLKWFVERVDVIVRREVMAKLWVLVSR